MCPALTEEPRCDIGDDYEPYSPFDDVTNIMVFVTRLASSHIDVSLVRAVAVDVVRVVVVVHVVLAVVVHDDSLHGRGSELSPRAYHHISRMSRPGSQENQGESADLYD